MAGFRSAVQDPIDEALYNWAIWAVGSSGSARLEPPEIGRGDTDGTKREPFHETEVSCIVGWALDVDHELGEIQARIDLKPDGERWPVRETVKRWYAGTSTDQYEAQYLGIPRSTFADRIDQVKKRIVALREMKLAARLYVRAA
jgi:hypothetical protein